MEPSSDTRMDCFESTSDISPSETPPKSRRIVSFYPTSAGSTALWPDDLPIGTDALTYPQGHSNQQLGSVTGLHAWIIEARSPLIAAAFESSVSGKRLHLDSLDSGTVLPFVRFLYTGYYAQIGDWEDVPTSVWLHCRMYYLGHLYDLADLKSQAYVNVLRQCEFGCSSPSMPIDLCPAIDFVYRHLSGHDAISDALVQYCVTRCLSHKLHENAEFRNLAFFVRAFHQDLTKACRDRDYEDESAAIIIQLPYMNYAPATYASTEHPPISRFEDIIHHFHSNDRFDTTSPKKRQRVTFDERQTSPTKVLKLQESTEQPVSKLALRQAPEKPAAVAFENHITLECEAKLPHVDATPETQQSSSQTSHRQQPQVIITSRCTSQQAAPTQRPPPRGVSSLAQKMIAKAKEEERLRKPSAVGIFSKAQRMMANLTEKERAQTREDILRNMSEQQIQQDLARKQDLLFRHIYEQVEEEAMDEWMLAQTAGGQQQEANLPLRPALGRPFPVTSYIMKKLPGRPPFPSSGHVPEDKAIHKDENLPIWKRRDMTGTNSGLSQALETLRNQEKQPHGDQSIESAASQQQGGPAMYQPKKDWRQRNVSDAGLNPTFHSLRSTQSITPCQDVIEDNHTPSMQQNSSARSTQDDPFKDCPEATTPSASVAPSPPLRVIHYPAVPINAGANSGNHALQDYQMQLMLLEQQNKKRLLMARQEQDSMTYPLNPLVNTSTNMQPAVPKEDYQVQLRPLEQQNKKRLLAARQEQGPMTHPCSPPVTTDMQSAVPPAVSKLQNETSSESCPIGIYTHPGVRNRRDSGSMVASSAVDAAAEPSTAAGASTRKETPVPQPSEFQRVALSDYKEQLRLGDENTTKTEPMARAEQESLRIDSSQVPVSELGKFQCAGVSDYKVRLMLLEQQNRKRLIMKRAAERESVERASASSPPPVPNPDMISCVDYSDDKFQLILLEQKEKKRLPMQRLAEQESLERTSTYMGDMRLEYAELGTGSDALDNFDFDAFLDVNVSPSSADDLVRDEPTPQQPDEARTLESHQAQLMHLEHSNRENHPRPLVMRLPTDPLPAAMQEATRATSRPAAAAPSSDHRQGGFTFACQNEGENDVLANFDFDAFLETNVMDGAFEFDEYPTEHEDLGCHNGLLFESDSEHGAASDSDAQSWVDVAMEPTGSASAMSPSGTAPTGLTASIPVPAPTRRSPSHSDSEWELC